MIRKIRSLNLKLKIFVGIIFTIIFTFGYNQVEDYFYNKEANYDYSQIYSVNGIVTDTYFEYEHNNDYDSYIDVYLETEKTITLRVSNHLDYAKGDSIIVYTDDGVHYAISERGIVLKEPINEIMFMFLLFFFACILLIWSMLFGWKGVAIAFFILLVNSI